MAVWGKNEVESTEIFISYTEVNFNQIRARYIQNKLIKVLEQNM